MTIDEAIERNRKIIASGYFSEGYNKAIDDFAEALMKYTHGRTNGVYIDIPLCRMEIFDLIKTELKSKRSDFNNLKETDYRTIIGLKAGMDIAIRIVSKVEELCQEVS